MDSKSGVMQCLVLIVTLCQRVQCKRVRGMHVMTCYAVLCYAVLCYAMLCYAMLCYAMLCYAMLCYAMPFCAVLCSGTFCTTNNAGSLVPTLCFPPPSSCWCLTAGNQRKGKAREVCEWRCISPGLQHQHEGDQGCLACCVPCTCGRLRGCQHYGQRQVRTQDASHVMSQSLPAHFPSHCGFPFKLALHTCLLSFHWLEPKLQSILIHNMTKSASLPPPRFLGMSPIMSMLSCP